MTKIEERLRRLQDTDDLSYSERPLEEGKSDAEGKVGIDDATLAQLLDECRDEQEHLSLLDGVSQRDDISSRHSESESALAVQPSEQSRMQLAEISE